MYHFADVTASAYAYFLHFVPSAGLVGARKTWYTDDMDKVLNVVGAIIIENGKLFAAKRGDSKYAYVAHKYEFAGGKVEAGESPETALARELREELDMPVDVVEHYMSLRHDYPDFSIELHTYRCRMLGGYKLLEHESADWIATEDLKPDEWAPADSPVIERLRSEAQGRKI